MRAKTRFLGAMFLAALLAATAAAAPAEVDVRGFGWLKNRELERSLALLLGDGTLRETVDASFLEDASLVLTSNLVEEGFFSARVEASWETPEGGRGRAELDAELSRPLPRPLVAKRVRLEARPGMRAVVAVVAFEGLEGMEPAQAEMFFRPRAGLFTPDAVRAWSPARVRRGAEQLREALRARGHAEARVEVAEARPDPSTGEVRLAVRVEAGPRWRVRAWRAEVEGGAPVLGGEPDGLLGAVWTRSLAQDLAHTLRASYHARGRAEARVRWIAEPAGEAENGERAVTAVARVEPGPAWRLGQTRVEGAARTQAGLMAQRVRLQAGEPYDPQAIDAARLRLARLDVFRRVDAAGVDTAEPGVRDVVFRVAEEPAWQAAWSIGYGSYEQLRGGAELSRGNLWGLAHRDRVELGQSLKASRGEYRYTVPTLFDDTVEGSARVFGLRREEPSFIRREYGGGVEAARDVPLIDARGTAGLSYEVLRADDVEFGAPTGEATETAVTALQLGLTRDRRDNPVRPRSGRRWSVRSETALPELGGEARYERLELAWSAHRALGEDRWLHLGVSHGLLADSGEDAPLNKLFFPGGESSIRGYGEGEASPRDASGRLIGARTVWLANVELEQVITGRWTAVVFSDTLGVAAEVRDWPGGDVLSSLGLGLRYQSPIGPVRLEYGRNLKRREGDPGGTLHFSIGFPF